MIAGRTNSKWYEYLVPWQGAGKAFEDRKPNVGITNLLGYMLGVVYLGFSLVAGSINPFGKFIQDYAGEQRRIDDLKEKVSMIDGVEGVSGTEFDLFIGLYDGIKGTDSSGHLRSEVRDFIQYGLNDEQRQELSDALGGY